MLRTWRLQGWLLRRAADKRGGRVSGTPAWKRAGPLISHGVACRDALPGGGRRAPARWRFPAIVAPCTLELFIRRLKAASACELSSAGPMPLPGMWASAGRRAALCIRRLLAHLGAAISRSGAIFRSGPCLQAPAFKRHGANSTLPLPHGSPAERSHHNRAEWRMREF